jgi:uncharacterized protein YaaN involved in tellurite resistance
MTEPTLNIDAPAAGANAAPAPATEAPAGVATTAGAAATQTATLVLTPPAPVVVVPATQAVGAVALDPATSAKLDGMVTTYLEAVTTLDVHGPAFTAKASDIQKLGDDDIRASAAVSNRLLDKPVSSVARSGLAPASNVSKSLLDLRHTVEDLDPSKQGDLFSPHKLLGIIPFGAGDKLRDYFGKYQSSQTHINAIITSLYGGRDELSRDNADIEQEKANLWSVMGRLRQYVYLGQQLDAGLTARIATIETTDAERAKVLKEDLLFYVRQKVQDLLTQLAVSVQGYLALDVIRRNNLELIKGVDRATTTTVSALRTAVIVAQALADQKLVLDQITALNTTTTTLIESTSTMLHQQSADISKQASEATIDLGKLQTAFSNIYQTMDEIDSFKVAALDNMQKTISALSTEVTKAQAYVDRSRTRDATSDANANGPRISG